MRKHITTTTCSTTAVTPTVFLSRHVTKIDVLRKNQGKQGVNLQASVAAFI